ncbi:MAG: hypothetical protein ACXV2F_06995 [Halobacteriota archaeon]
MFDMRSRYYALEDATFTEPNGRTVVYKRRRILPQGTNMPLLAEVEVDENSRLDKFTADILGDPEQFWRICDANDTMNPNDLAKVQRVPDVPRVLRVPAPSANGGETYGVQL